MNLSFSGQVAVVTGAAGGIGRATANAFLAAGARVALLDIDEEGLARGMQDWRASNGRALPIVADIGDAASVQRAVDQTLAAFERIDILVNNAAVAAITFMANTSIETWDHVINTNLRGTFLMSRAAMQPMLRQGQGSIINVASVDGLKGRAGGAAYCASKAGIIRFSESCADEVAKYGIRVNVICPAGVNTSMWRKSHPDMDAERVLQPHDVAEAILFLTSDHSRAINGATIEMLGPRLQWGTYL